MTVEAICTSHSPFMGLLSPGEEVERAVLDEFERLAGEVKRFDPELILLLAPDHFNGFFYGLMPPFCVGVRAEGIGDYGSLAGPIKVDEAQALALVEAAAAEGFDLAVSYRMQVDHGFSQPLQYLAGGLDAYPVVPVFINAVAPPRPSCRRTREFGEMVGRFAQATGKRCLIVGSGGLSHDPPVPAIADAPPDVVEQLIAGQNPPLEARRQREERTLKAGEAFAAGETKLLPLNEAWDLRVLDALKSADWPTIDAYDDQWITAEGGRAGHEIRTWIATFAALSTAGAYDMRVRYQQTIPHWIVGMAMAHGQVADAA